MTSNWVFWVWVNTSPGPVSNDGFGSQAGNGFFELDRVDDGLCSTCGGSPRKRPIDFPGLEDLTEPML